MMNHLLRAGALGLLLAAFWAAGPVVRAQEASEPPPFLEEDDVPPLSGEASEPTPAPDGISVQTRGPVHEAYAQPTDTSPQRGPVVPRQPPDPIPEEPPAERPEGDNVVWIPGYWAWDIDRDDFLWVSGFWGVPPRGGKWVPGSGGGAGGGWRWVCGFWASERREEMSSPPAPPEPPEEGPPVPPP